MAATPFDPEAISVALFNLIEAQLQQQSTIEFQEISRRPEIGQNIDLTKRPAVYVVQRHIGTEQREFALPIYKLNYMVYVAAWSNSAQKELPETFLNNVFKIFTQAVVGQPGRGALPGIPQTLNGLVVNVWIEGESPIVQGIVPTDELWRMIPIVALTGL